MGLTKVTTKISGFGDSRKSYEAVFLVDAGEQDAKAAAGNSIEIDVWASAP